MKPNRKPSNLDQDNSNPDQSSDDVAGSTHRQRRNASDSDSSYEVGYGKPPKRSQFPKGTSGNRKGRPKGQKSSNDLFETILRERVRVRVNDRDRTITMKEAILRRLVTEAAKGNRRALMAVINRESERILDEDLKIAKNKKTQEAFAKELDEIFRNIDKKKKQKEAERKAREEERFLKAGKIYDPDAT